LNFQPHPTEPANYRGSNNTEAKEIADIEIPMYQSAGTIVTTAVQLLLLKLTASEEEQEEGGLRN
jgi:hypothetical protein